jgi:hypothetical protein
VSVQYVITTSNVALTAATARTVIEGVTGATGNPPEWIGVDITFDGVTATAVPVRVDFCTYAATGTGTSQTPKKLGAALGTAASTWKINDTVEPTTPAIIYSWWIPPTTGLIGFMWPLGRELLQPLSTVQGIRLTAPAAVNAIVNLIMEE